MSEMFLKMAEKRSDTDNEIEINKSNDSTTYSMMYVGDYAF